jgi:hypothetical protein
MKTLIYAALAVLLAAPVVSFAQDANGPVTRAQVETDLLQLESAGYHPAANDIHYPAGIQAAEARVHSNNSGNNAYGGVAESTSSAGVPQAGGIATHSIYYGH